MRKACIGFGGTAVALFIGYATVSSTTASWIIAVLWWGFIVVAVLFFLTGLTYLLLWFKKYRKKEILKVSKAEIYNVGDGSQWLRLEVQNPNSTYAKGCYGKLLERKMVGELSKIAAFFDRQKGVAKAGNVDLKYWRLPPEGHRFPWSLTDHSLITIPISENGGSEYLYLATKRKQANCLCFPKSTGNEYANYRLCDFEIKLEIGSETETFRTTKVFVVFKATANNIELVRWCVVD